MKKLYIIPLLLIILLAGCKRHLELKPISLISAGSFLRTEGDVEPALNGMYFRLRPLGNYNLFIWGEGRSEIMEATGVAGVAGNDIYYLNILTRDNISVNWDIIYQTINAANLVIKYTPDITFSNSANKDNALAQAYTMRAYCYFLLAKIYGSVPLRTAPTENYDPIGIQVPKTAEADVFKLIKEDLDKAIPLFTVNTLPAGRNKWSKAAANALKGDVYLWTGKRLSGGNADFTTALNALNDAQTAPALNLLPSYADIFKYANKGNNEIIMAIRFTTSEPSTGNVQTYAHNMYASNTAYPAYVPQSQRDIVGAPLAGNGNVWRLSALVRNQFTNDDTRKAATYIDMMGTGPNEYYTNYGLKFNGTVEAGARVFASDCILYRLADILLMKAEAKNALNQDPTAEMVLVRQRAYGSNYASHVFVNGTPAQNNDAILKERLLELALEGKRWWDLVRFGKAFDLVPSLQGRSAQTYLLYWPIGTATRTREPLVEETTGW
jgi:hypothetical protein